MASTLVAASAAVKEPILIIGAGLGGLALAQGLRKAGLPFKIFERDQTPRSQGYRIRLHGEGIVGLHSVLTPEIWTLFEQTCPETRLGPIPQIDAVTCDFKFVQGGGSGGPGGPANFGGFGGPGGRVDSSKAAQAQSSPSLVPIQSGQKPYSVDRGVMREVLLTGLESYITFGKSFSHFRLTDSGVIADFSDGSTESGSLLVGADGVRSAVRKQYLPQLRILDMRGHLVYGKTPLTSEFESAIAPETMRTMSAIKDPKTHTVTLMEAMRFSPEHVRPKKPQLPKDYVYWVMALPGGNNSLLHDLDIDHPDMVKSPAAYIADRLTSHWHPSVRPLIEYQDPSQTGIFKLLSSPADIEAWEPDARVTLLGDACHPMIPAAASGAVTAMRDAALLTKVINERAITKESIGMYESEMRKYAGHTVALSACIGVKTFGQIPLEECKAADM